MIGNDGSTEKLQGRLYGAFGMFVCQLLHVVVLYIYLVLAVRQGAEDENKQMAAFWRFGKVNFCVQILLLTYGLVEYIFFINLRLQHIYDISSLDIFGVFGSYQTVVILMFGLFVLAHLTFLPLIAYHDKKKTAVGL